MRRASVVCAVGLLLMGTLAFPAAAQQDLFASLTPCVMRCAGAAQGLGVYNFEDQAVKCFNSASFNSTACCNKATGLFTKNGPLSGCLCCTDWVSTFVASLPWSSWNTTSEKLTKQWASCRVPVLGVSGPITCNPQGASSFFRQTTYGPGTLPWPPRDSINGSNPLQVTNSALKYLGLDPDLNAWKLEIDGRQLVANGTSKLVQLPGADESYRYYLAGYLYWIKQQLPTYTVPKFAPLPPLPDKFKADMAWIKSVKRGPYPDVLKLRPASLSMKATDPLQNGKISNLSPAPAFMGRIRAPGTISPNLG